MLAGMSIFLGSLLIFGLRILDVSIGTVRVLYTIKGQRLMAGCLGFFEAGIYIVAITRVMAEVHTLGWTGFVGYALGFSTGTVVGITLDKWIGSGWVLARVISREHGPAICGKLREHDFGVTEIDGKGRDGAVPVLFAVAARKRATELLKLIEHVDEGAFVTIDPVNRASGGFVPVVSASSVRK